MGRDLEMRAAFSATSPTSDDVWYASNSRTAGRKAGAAALHDTAGQRATSRLAASWIGYAHNGVSLASLPEYIDVVHLFMINLWPGDGLNTDVITSAGISFRDILEGARALQRRGTRVVVSIASNPYPRVCWASVADPATLARNINDLVVNEWGLDGIDIDPEVSDGDTMGESFVRVVEELSRYFGPQSGRGTMMTLVSRDLNAEGALLRRTRDAFDYVTLVGYYWPLTEMKNQFEQYAKTVGAGNVLFAVSAGNPTTPLQEVIQLARWQPRNERKGGMMAFNINADTDFGLVGAMHGSLVS